MSQHTYASTYPSDIQVNPAVKKFFEDFYAISDTPGEHEVYVDQFVGDAVFVLGNKKVRGRDEILTIRKAMWATITSRLHSPQKVFPFGSNANEFMIIGTVAFGLADGRKSEMDWAARAVMVEEGGKWRFGEYQVYLDSAAVQANAR